MPFSVHQTESTLRLELEGEVTIRQAGDLAARIGEVLDGCSSVVIETARLQDADTSILQLLCSLHKTAPALSFNQPSANFLAAVDRCGLRRELLGGVREGG
ncbi:MAG: lipid asymmetry maintenance protein MlaB [Bryobacteraceae bacterium]